MKNVAVINDADVFFLILFFINISHSLDNFIYKKKLSFLIVSLCFSLKKEKIDEGNLKKSSN